MKRNILIATVAAAALIGGTFTAFAVMGDDDAPGTANTASSASSASSAPVAETGDDRTDDGRTADDGKDDDGGRNASEAGAARLTVAEALDAALKKVPGTVVSAELDHGRGGLAWDVDVLGEDGRLHDVTVDAGDGGILGARAGDDDDNRDDVSDGNRDDGVAGLRDTRTTAREAADAALESVPGTVTSVELDDDGGPAWEVEVWDENGKRHELAVDAATGGSAADRDDSDSSDDAGADG